MTHVVAWSARPDRIACGARARRPPLIGLVTGAHPGNRALALLTRWLLIYGSLATLAAVEHRLTSPRFTTSVLSADLRRVFLLRREGGPPVTAFPFLRDYASLVHAWMIGYIAVSTGGLLDAIGRMVPDMVASGSLLVRRPSEFARRLARLDARLQNRALHLGVLLCAVALTAFGLVAFDTSGIYTFLTPAGTPPASFSGDAWLGWWAHPFSPGGDGWIFWAVVGNYVDLWVGYVGVEVAVFFVRNRGLLHLSMDPGNADSRWGWEPVVAVVSAGRRIAVAASVGLGAIALIANPASYAYLVLFPLCFATVACLFLVPNVFYATARARFLASPPEPGTDPALAAIQRALVPERILRPRDFLYQLTLTIVPGLLSIVSLVEDVLH